MTRLTRTLTALAVLALPYPALAQDQAQQAQVRGFASWGFGRSDPHAYLLGTGEDHNEFQNVDFALNVSATPTDRLRISTQVFWEVTHEGQEVELDFASAEWTFSDKARVRFGRSPFPFGVYAEIQDVGTLRPFYTLPQSVYGPTGLAAEAYDGVAELWFDDAAAVEQARGPEAAEAALALLEDERRFIDHARSPIWIAEEHPIIEFAVPGR